jgi:glyceraldehyde 3-phosphate dehydrogenase
MRIGINGMGRIGRLAFRAAFGAAERGLDDPRRNNRIDIVHVNEIKGGVAATAHLLQFDTVQGRWRANVKAEGENAIFVDGKQIGYSSHPTAADIPWGDLGVDVVLECTGKFLSHAMLDGHLQRGAKRVIVAAPVKELDVLNIVVGINHHLYDPARHPIVTAASCTTNCLAPVVKVVHENIGIRHGQITTIHDPTNTNVVVDAPHKDLRRARSAMLSLQPTTTGSATAIALIYPELKGKLNGHAVRAPVLNACSNRRQKARWLESWDMKPCLWCLLTMPAIHAHPSSMRFQRCSPMAPCSRSMPGMTMRWVMPAAWLILRATCRT